MELQLKILIIEGFLFHLLICFTLLDMCLASSIHLLKRQLLLSDNYCLIVQGHLCEQGTTLSYLLLYYRVILHEVIKQVYFTLVRIQITPCDICVFYVTLPFFHHFCSIKVVPKKSLYN